MAMQEDMADFFNTGEFAVSVTYFPASGAPSNVEAIILHGVSRMGFDANIVAPHTEIVLRADQVDAPVVGDTIQDGLVTYTVRDHVASDSQTRTVIVDP